MVGRIHQGVGERIYRQIIEVGAGITTDHTEAECTSLATLLGEVFTSSNGDRLRCIPVGTVKGEHRGTVVELKGTRLFTVMLQIDSNNLITHGTNLCSTERDRDRIGTTGVTLLQAGSGI